MKTAPIHIDKAVRVFHDDGRIEEDGAKLFVKIDPSQLDGKVTRVGFEGTEDSSSWGDVGSGRQSKHVEIDAKPFAGSSDYFELPTMFVSGEDRDAGGQVDSYHGDIFVQTDKGTRYEAKVMGGGELYVDSMMADNLHTQFDPGSVSWINNQPDVGSIPVTADSQWPSSERYLNPDGDR